MSSGRSARRATSDASSGKTIAVRLLAVGNDDRRVEGELLAADDDGITVGCDGTERTIPYAQIDRARTVFVWGPQPKHAARTKKSGSKSHKSKEKKPS